LAESSETTAPAATLQGLCPYAVCVKPVVHSIQGFGGAAKEPHEANPHMNVRGLDRPPSCESPATRLIAPVQDLAHFTSLQAKRSCLWSKHCKRYYNDYGAQSVQMIICTASSVLQETMPDVTQEDGELAHSQCKGLQAAWASKSIKCPIHSLRTIPDARMDPKQQGHRQTPKEATFECASVVASVSGASATDILLRWIIIPPNYRCTRCLVQVHAS
jgi:hypothetical protein